jgi:REP element-mobilizing transposase RayT
MANTYTALNYHVVFSTKNREPWLSPEIRGRLWPYLGGVARQNAMTMLEIGGVADHVHLLLAAPASLALAKGIQLLKGGSSHWLKDEFPHLAAFAWQDGYGAFTVSPSQLSAVRRYLQRQEEHHRARSFAKEYRAFLHRHGIVFDEKFLLD